MTSFIGSLFLGDYLSAVSTLQTAISLILASPNFSNLCAFFPSPRPHSCVYSWTFFRQTPSSVSSVGVPTGCHFHKFMFGKLSCKFQTSKSNSSSRRPYITHELNCLMKDEKGMPRRRRGEKKILYISFMITTLREPGSIHLLLSRHKFLSPGKENACLESSYILK